MTVGAARTLDSPDPFEVDQRVFMSGVAWDDLEALLRARGESSAVRITYLEGTVELMSPSRHHERDKKKLARLLEAWAEEQGVELEGYGSWTVKRRDVERAAEADECYVVGFRDADTVESPDIAIEVVWTSGGLDKLEVWRKLGAREVWIWERGTLAIHVLAGEHYEPAARSELLPSLDPTLLARHMAEPSQSRAVRALRSELRA